MAPTSELKTNQYIVYHWTVTDDHNGWYHAIVGSVDSLKEVVRIINDHTKKNENKNVYAVIDYYALDLKYPDFLQKFQYISDDILMVDGCDVPGDEIELDSYRCGEDSILIAAGSAAHCNHYLQKVIDNDNNAQGIEDDFERNFDGPNESHVEDEDEDEDEEGSENEDEDEEYVEEG